MLPELAKHSEKLTYFYEIINEGSLQATSRKLGVSASGLSYTIKELEKVCKVSLLKRSKKGVVPTEAGVKLFQLCRTVYREMERVQLEMQGQGADEIHRIRVGTFSSIAIYFWPLLLKEIARDSRLSMSISTGRSKEILELLIRKEVDVAITVECFTHARLVKHELYADSFSFYVATGKKIESLNDEVLYYIPDTQDRDGKKLRQHLQGMDVRFKEECELDSFEVIAQFVANGFGVGILPNKVALGFGKAITKVGTKELKKDFGAHRFYLSYRDDLEMAQKDLELILGAAKKAVTKLK